MSSEAPHLLSLYHCLRLYGPDGDSIAMSMRFDVLVKTVEAFK